MKAYKSLIRILIIYLLLFVFINLIFGLLYSYIALQNNTDSNLWKWYYFALMNFATISHGDISPLPNMRVIIVIQYIFTSIINPITSGFIFYYILNRTPKIKFPKYILIRKRSSFGSNGLITLGLMIGNNNKHKIYDVKCTLVYVYYKKRFDGKTTRNAETILIQTTPYIHNYYRFSFQLNDFPSILIKSIISPNNISINDSFVVIINGRYGDYGDTFITEKEFSINDLVIAKETELISENQKVKSIIKWTKPDWYNMDKLILYSEEDKEELVNELKRLVAADIT